MAAWALVGTVSGTIVDSSGVYSAKSAGIAISAPGTYYWVASYGGDTNNNGAGPSTCGASGEKTVVTAVISPTTTDLSATSTCANYSYSQTFTTGVSGYAYKLSTTAPPGLTFSSTGTLSGTPTKAGKYAFTVTASGSGFTSVSASSILTIGLCLNGGRMALTAGTHDQSYSSTLGATGGTAPYRFQLQSGGLPPGLTMTSSGTISGTPSTAGTYSFTVVVLDSADPVNEGESTLTLTVS